MVCDASPTATALQPHGIMVRHEGGASPSHAQATSLPLEVCVQGTRDAPHFNTRQLGPQTAHGVVRLVAPEFRASAKPQAADGRGNPGGALCNRAWGTTGVEGVDGGPWRQPPGDSEHRLAGSARAGSGEGSGTLPYPSLPSPSGGRVSRTSPGTTSHCSLVREIEPGCNASRQDVDGTCPIIIPSVASSSASVSAESLSRLGDSVGTSQVAWPDEMPGPWPCNGSGVAQATTEGSSHVTPVIAALPAPPTGTEQAVGSDEAPLSLTDVASTSSTSPEQAAGMGRQPTPVTDGEPAAPPTPTGGPPPPCADADMRVPDWMRKRVAVRRTIPRSAWEVWGGCFADAVNAVTDALGADDAALAAATEHFLLLPRQMLGSGRAGKRATRAITSRCKGKSDPLAPNPPASRQQQPSLGSLPPQSGAQHRVARRVLDFMQAGRLHKAAEAVNADSAVRASPEVAAALRKLHPQAPVPDPVPRPAALPPQLPPVDTTLLANVVKALPRLSGAGPSGMCYEHIRAAVAGNARVLPALVKLVNAALLGRFRGRADMLLACRLVALPKQGGGVRPLALGEVCARIISICAVRLARRVPDALAPTQLGVGVPGAIESILHSVRSAVRQNPDWLVVTLDWRNAFNSVSREAVLHNVSLVEPNLLGWANTLYTQHSALLMDDGTVLSSQQGVRQGDPLSPMAFDLAIQPVLNAASLVVKSKGGLVKAYHDDLTIVAPREACKAIVRLVQLRGQRLGLTLRPDKCYVTCAAAAATGTDLETPESVAATKVATDFAQEHGFQYAPAGVKLLGAAVGGDAFLTDACRSTAEDVQAWADALSALPIPAHAKLLLLKSSGSARLAHLARWLPPGVATRLCHPAAQGLHTAVAKLAGLESLPDRASKQAALPTRLGGLGLPLWDRLECAAAYCAGAGDASRVLVKYDELRWLPASPAAPDPALTHAVEALTSYGVSEAKRPLVEVPRGWQQTLMQALMGLRRTALESELSLASKARLKSASAGGASAWTRATPVGECSLTDDELQLNIRLWLGLPIPHAVPPRSAPSKCCLRTGQHPLTCALLDDGLRQAVMLDAWTLVLRVAGVPVRVITSDQRARGQPAATPPRASQPASQPRASAAAAPDCSEPTSSHCSQSAKQPQRHARNTPAGVKLLETGLGGTARWLLPWLGGPKRCNATPAVPGCREVPCNWFGAPTRAAKGVLRLARKAASAQGVPGWAFDVWARNCLSVAAARANARAITTHLALARGLPLHQDPDAAAIAQALVTAASEPPEIGGIACVPGAPPE